jgi:hypothetical protein
MPNHLVWLKSLDTNSFFTYSYQVEVGSYRKFHDFLGQSMGSYVAAQLVRFGEFVIYLNPKNYIRRPLEFFLRSHMAVT